jgi:predicted ATPase
MSKAAETMRPRICELRLRRFRAFENARLILNDLTVIVGRNGSGKSTLMEAFDFVQDAVTHSVLTALERRGGINSIVHRPSSQQHSNADVEIAIAIALPVTHVLYGFTLAPFRSRSGYQVKRETLKTYPKESFSFSREGRDFTSQIRGARPSVGRESLVLPLVAEHEEVWKMTLDVLARLLVYSFSPQDMQSEPRIGSQQALVRDGSNIGDVLRRLDDDKAEMDWIMRHLTSITRGITHVQASASAGRRIVTFFQQTGKRESRFVASDMSHGTLHSLGVLVALRQQPVPSLVFVNEIEASIHTAALSALMDAANVSSKERCQVILSSHSTDALSHAAVNAENVRIVDWQDDRSFIFHVGEGARELLVPPETVGRLLRSNALWTEEQPKTVAGDIFDVTSDVAS